MAAETKKSRRHINTNIDFEFRSPVLKAVLSALLIVLLLVIAGYQIVAYTKTKKELPTETALSSTIYRTVTADAVVLRTETPLAQTASGTVVPLVDNGSKVAVNDTVARIFTSPADAQNFSSYAQLEDEIRYYEEIAALSSGNLVAGIDTYNNNVMNRLLDLQNRISEGRLSGLSDAVRDFSESVTKKQIAVGGTVDVSAKLFELNSRMSEINGAVTSYSSVTAPAAGYYVNSTDGYEDIYDMSDVASLTSTDIEGLLNAVPSAPSANVGKLITEFNWYLVCVADEASVDMLEVGDRVKIAVDELGGEVISMQIKAKNIGADSKAALVFTSNVMNADFAALRFSQIKIRVEEYKGYPIDKTAVRTVDGEVGVYIQLGNMIRFRKINIVYSDDNIILAEASNEDGYLKLYDEVIIEGVDNDDGKIII